MQQGLSEKADHFVLSISSTENGAYIPCGICDVSITFLLCWFYIVSLCPCSKTRGALGLVAHRGAGLDAPENTLESLRLCKKKGAKCVEFDVALTLDNVAVVFHDDTVDRVSDKTGHIDQMTFDQVKDSANKKPA